MRSSSKSVRLRVKGSAVRLAEYEFEFEEDELAVIFERGILFFIYVSLSADERCRRVR